MATKQRAGGTQTQPMLDGMEPTPRELGFRGPQVCSIVGITYRQLDYWARTDLVRPSITDAKGSGTQRTYSFQDLVRLKVVRSLLDAGVRLQTARQPSTSCAPLQGADPSRPRRCPTSRCASRTTRNDSSRSSSTSTPSTGSTSRAR